MGRFDGQTVIVTGGSRGMGESHVHGFIEEGASVVIADVLEDEGRALASGLGARGVFVRLDVTSDEQWDDAVRTAEERFGPVSVLVNNAGIAQYQPLVEIDPALWRRVLEINLTGTFLGIRAVAESMRRAGGGAIVNISSEEGLTAHAGFGAYGTSKWGVRGLTKYAALELGHRGIRVNSIHPGFTATAMLDTADPSSIAAMSATLPIPRVAQPREVTKLVLFVASEEAGYMTGTEFVIDGGLLLGQAPLEEPGEVSAH
jgi:3alpha(or 20beta)-hydroxysteroid dehydrogenase